MHPRERWQALQTTLTAARSAVERGDREAALDAVNAALELDPNFLAAHSLRERIVAGDLAVSPPAASAVNAVPHTNGMPNALPQPIARPDGYAKFEQRAMRRRVDRRVEAAKQAIERKHLKQAAAALDEVIELDPNLPELSDLTVQFDLLRRSTARSKRGPTLAAAAVIAVSLLGGASWLRDPSVPLLSRSTIAAVPLIAAPATSTLDASELEPVATSGVDVAVAQEKETPVNQTVERVEPPPARPVQSVAAAVLARPAAEPIVEPPVAAAIAVTLPPPPIQPPPTQPPAPVVVAPARPPQEAAAVVAPVMLPVLTRVEEDEHALVKQTLQRYRSAYEGLDARSAHAVWPAVNQVALARAFDGLQSQTLIFNACEVRVRGDAATATCSGSARYVAKVGNHEPRTEPRVWTFTLRKIGEDWKIDSARADR